MRFCACVCEYPCVCLCGSVPVCECLLSFACWPCNLLSGLLNWLPQALAERQYNQAASWTSIETRSCICSWNCLCICIYSCSCCCCCWRIYSSVYADICVVLYCVALGSQKHICRALILEYFSCLAFIRLCFVCTTQHLSFIYLACSRWWSSYRKFALPARSNIISATATATATSQGSNSSRTSASWMKSCNALTVHSAIVSCARLADTLYARVCVWQSGSLAEHHMPTATRLSCRTSARSKCQTEQQ